MNNVLDQQNDISKDVPYATPFNIDLSRPNPAEFFHEYIRRVSSLPKSVRNILMDTSTAEFIEENLGPTFNLNNEQKVKITRTIRDILLGDAPLNSMPGLISSKLNIDQSSAVQIANKIVSDLFGPAIEDIKKLQTERFQRGVDKQNISAEPQTQKIPEKPDLKIDPGINKNNIVDLRNK